MTDQTNTQPYIPRNPGDLITAEDWNDVQVSIRDDLAANAAADAKSDQELKTMIANVDAPKFGGKTPDDWTDDLDKRYIRRDDPGAMGEYRRYFKQLNRQVVPPGGGSPIIEPAVIEHKFCRFPLAEVHELLPVFAHVLGRDDDLPANMANMENIKFLIYYASKRDPVAEVLFTESSDRFYWGDTLVLLLSQLNLKPALSQKFDDLVNDIFGKMFDPGLEQDQFDRDTYGVSPYVQNWIDKDQTVGDLMKGGQWNDLRIAIRPRMLPVIRELPDEGGPTAAQIFHINQNMLEIRVNNATDVMAILRS